MAKKKQEDLSSYDAVKKAFIKRCEDLSHVRSLHDVIRDFAELGRITIVNQLTPFYSQDAEDIYLKTIKKYNSDEQSQLAQMLAMVSMAHELQPGDFLGETLMELSMGRKELGQFFTPYSLCRLNAELTLSADSVNDKGYVSLSEPAAGGGGMVIAAHHRATELNVDLYAHCVELSHMTADLCYINLSAAGVAAHVTQGNTLSMKMGRSFPTPALCTQQWSERL
jgi:type I restriction-modification system DNA methylase subunit